MCIIKFVNVEQKIVCFLFNFQRKEWVFLTKEEGEIKKDQKKSKKKKIIIIVLAVLLIIFASVSITAYYFYWLPMQEEVIIDYKYKLDSFVVNIAEEHRRYLKIDMSLLYHSEELEEKLEEKEDKIRDEVIDILRGKTMEEIQREGSMENIKNEVLNSINQVLDKNKIKSIYFTDFIIQ